MFLFHLKFNILTMVYELKINNFYFENKTLSDLNKSISFVVIHLIIIITEYPIFTSLQYNFLK